MVKTEVAPKGGFAAEVITGRLAAQLVLRSARETLAMIAADSGMEPG
jgi:hypothetical protein